MPGIGRVTPRGGGAAAPAAPASRGGGSAGGVSVTRGSLRRLALEAAQHLPDRRGHFVERDLGEIARGRKLGQTRRARGVKEAVAILRAIVLLASVPRSL